MPLLRAVYGSALAAWAGIAGYTSALLLPDLAARLPDAFGPVTRLVFAGYFRTGEALAAAATVAALLEWSLLRRRGGGAGALLRLAAAAAALALLAYAGEVLLPGIREARGEDARFAALHARAMAINGAAALLALAGALLAHLPPPARPGPRP